MSATASPTATGESPFASLETYIGLPRVVALALAPDGTRAVLTVATLSSDRTRFTHSLWSVSTTGDGTPRRLADRVTGAAAAFTSTGDVLFVSERETGDDGDGADPRRQLWRLPAVGGEARPVTRLAGGVASIIATARERDRVVIAAELLRSSESLADDARARAERERRKVTAILHESYPVRFWDHDIGVGDPHLLALDLTEHDEAIPDAARAAARERARADDDGPAPYPAELPEPRDLTPRPLRSADISGGALTPDGTTLVAELQVARARAGQIALAAYDTATAQRTVLHQEPGVDFTDPVMSHSGTLIAYQRHEDPTAAAPTPWEIWVSDISGANPRRVAADWDRIAHELAFTPDDDALIACADDLGRAPVFRIGLDDGAVTRLTDDDAAYSSLRVDRSSGAMVALRASISQSPHPVRIDPDGTITPLPTPAPPPPIPGRIEEVRTSALDGTEVRGWLVLPEGASPERPAPLLLWIHGGPLSSWNAWSWRWCPALPAARGYAVLLPDPALSTGYGLQHIARGWDAWGEAPYTDLMAITDAALERDDLDAGYTAAMGGSFGGYMANWVAGHTDRFDAIVTHASLWSLESFRATTDRSDFWDMVFTPEGSWASSPHRFVADIRTPMLVIHGDRDYRVPIGEGMRLWSDLATHHAREDGSTDHRYLYFPDEHHWIMRPQHAIVWWETVFAFLAQHVRGDAWERPAQLG